MKSSQYLLGSLRWKIALNISNYQNQKAKQNKYFYCIVDKKMYASAYPAACIKSGCLQSSGYEPVQPFHS